MKKIYILTAAISLLVILCFSCQSVPLNQPAADPDKTQAIILPSASIAPPSEAVAPERVSMRIKSDKGACSIAVEAKVGFTQSDDYSVVGIMPEAITQEEADRLIAYFFDGARLYAVDDPQKESISPEFQETQEMGVASRFIRAKADVGEGTDTYINIENRFDLQNNCLQSRADIFADMGRNVLPDSNLPAQAQGTALTPEKAKAKAENLLKELGIEDATVTSIIPGSMQNDFSRQGYMVEAHRAVNGIPETGSYIEPQGENQDGEQDVFRADDIRIAVDDDGISRFSWMYKSRITETISHNSAILPFEKIRSIMEMELKSRYGWVDGAMYAAQNAKLAIQIKKINLEYKCIPDKNDPASFVMAPVWNFYGDSVYTDANGTIPNYYAPSDSVAYLCINALDGSVINTNYYTSRTGGSIA